MNLKQKIALVAAVLNVAFAVLKFLMYGLTGSLAVLAEAWHSLTDICTSLLVFFTLRDWWGDSAIAGGKPAEAAEGTLSPRSRTGNQRPLESRIAILIGIFILFAAVGMIRKVIAGPRVAITYPAITGILFLVFASASYIVYRFEAKLGRQHDSPGLVADSLHSKSDMVGSLITGFSMLIMTLGLNLDRLAALLISALMLSFALETLLNAGGARAGARLSLVAVLLDRDGGRKLRGRLDRAFSTLVTRPQVRNRLVTAGKALLLLAAIAGAIRLCCFSVGPSQEAVRERLGRPLNWGRPIGPGLHFKLPWPIEKVVRVDSRAVKTMNVGNVPSPASPAYLWTVQHGTEEPYLSADNNLFYPYIVIHYRIRDIFSYLYRHRNSEELLNQAATGIATRLFSGREFYDIAITSRRILEEELRRRAQQKMDSLEAGLEIVSVNSRDIHPPIRLAAAYESVIAAWQEKEQMINRALAYRNSRLPEARGQEARALAQAEADSRKKRDAAVGETGGFLARRAAFRMYPDVLARRLLFQTVGEALAGRKAIIIDPAAGAPDLWIGNGSVGAQELLDRERFLGKGEGGGGARPSDWQRLPPPGGTEELDRSLLLDGD